MRAATDERVDAGRWESEDDRSGGFLVDLFEMRRAVDRVRVPNKRQPLTRGKKNSKKINGFLLI